MNIFLLIPLLGSLIIALPLSGETTALSTVALPNDLCAPEPYLLPSEHPALPHMNQLFADPSVLHNDEALKRAGFTIISAHKTSFVRVMTHPLVKGYILKAYIESEPQRRQGFSGQEWLIRRCLGAQKIRDLIQAKQMKYFSVPNKWLYKVPGRESTYVLIAQKMHIYSKEKSLLAWKEMVTREYLDELFLLLKLGCASKHLSVNIPYTKEGTFSFIDTEYPLTPIDLAYITHFLSPSMQIYWQSLISSERPS